MIANSRFWSPHTGGLIIGFAMILAYYVSGRGVGVSGAISRFSAVLQEWVMPDLSAKSTYFAKYFAHGANPLDHYLIYMAIGMMAGSFVGGFIGNHLCVEVVCGPRVKWGTRMVLALLGGLLVGFAARLARGCTSGQALVGASELSVGSWVFMLCIFVGGFGAAWFVRRQWI